MKKQSVSAKPSGKGFLIIGVLLGIAVAAALMLFSAAILLLLDADRFLAAPLATVCASAGTFAAAFYNSRKIGSRGYLTGLATGSAVFSAILLVSFIAAENSLSLNTAFHFVIMLLSGLLGGIWGVNSRNNKKYF